MILPLLTFYLQNYIIPSGHADKSTKRFSTSGEKNICLVVQILNIIRNVIAFSEIISIGISRNLFHR